MKTKSHRQLLLSILLAILILPASREAVRAGTGFMGSLVQSVSLSPETSKIIGTVNIAAGQAITATGTFWATAAASPSATRLSDGSAFYNALTDTQLRATAVPVSMSSAVSIPTVAKVGATTTSAQLIAANATRKAIQIKTDCANTDSVAINYGASAAVYASHDQLPPCASWEPPSGISVQTAIQVISNTGTQQVRVIEYP